MQQLEAGQPLGLWFETETVQDAVEQHAVAELVGEVVGGAEFARHVGRKGEHALERLDQHVEPLGWTGFTGVEHELDEQLVVVVGRERIARLELAWRVLTRRELLGRSRCNRHGVGPSSIHT